jgi:hypothetical protein
VAAWLHIQGFFGGGQDLVYKCWGCSAIVDELLGIGWRLFFVPCRSVLVVCLALIMVDEMVSVVGSCGCNMLDIV